MLIPRLKQCEHALSDGRLDEAFDLARHADLRSHRRGQELATRLVTALVERGRLHLAAGRLPQASGDADKAAFLAGNQPDVAQLRVAVNFALQQGADANRQVVQAVAAARFHADKGQLTVGQALIGAAPPTAVADGRVQGLKHDLAARRASLESSLEKISAALEAGDWESAIDHLAAYSAAGLHDAQLRLFCNKTAALIAAKTAQAIETGRLDLAAAYVLASRRLPIRGVELDNLGAVLDQFRAAYAHIHAAHADQAQQALHRLATLWPTAAWIPPLVEQTKQLGQTLTALHGSPLSFAAIGFPSPRAAAVTIAPPLPPPLPVESPDRYVLHIDGVGSFLVATQTAVTLGPVGASRHVDLPLMLDPSVPPVTLTRHDGDYFLRASRPIVINDQPTTSKLLASGDRMGLGARGRVTFRRPSAASGTALIELSGTRLSDAAIRQVVLMDREVLIGPSPSSHIQTGDSAAIVLQKRGPEWFCRSAAPITIDQKPAGNATPVALGAHISIGSLSLVIAKEGAAVTEPNPTEYDPTAARAFQFKHGDRPLDGYTIQRAIGRGGFGEVYYAVSDGKKDVALKVINTYEQIELRGTAQCINLKSPNLVTIFDVKTGPDGRPWIIMEYISGPTLHDLIKAAPDGLGPEKGAFFLREIAKGLTDLHNFGVIHRDLSPSNIFHENNTIKIGDYGLSKAMTMTQHSGQTVVVGKLHYMAPEIGFGRYDRLIDIYALGVVLYEMITGKVPFDGSTWGEVIIKHSQGEVKLDGIAEPFKSVLAKAMAKNPADRYQSAAEMVEALCGRQPIPQTFSQFSPPAQTRSPAPRAAATVAAQNPSSKLSAAALTSLICALTPIPVAAQSASIVFGAVGLSRIARSGGALHGKAFAIAGMVISSIALFLILFVLLFPLRVARPVRIVSPSVMDVTPPLPPGYETNSDFNGIAAKAVADAMQAVLTHTQTELAIAENNIGDDYRYGRVRPQNYAQALTWYAKAAALGNPDAMRNLGDLYERGLGVGKDDRQARAWYHKSTDARGPKGRQRLSDPREEQQP